jgi:hypothetical protein
MGLSYPTGNYSPEFNSVYNITLDMSGWDRTTIQLVSPMAGGIFVYGTNDGGAVQGVTQGNATLATNFNPIQATNLATGVATNVLNSAGNYEVNINAQYLRLQGSPAGAGSSVYKILLEHSKIG